MRSPRVIDAVESFYDLSGDAEAWVRRVIASVDENVGEGLGGLAHTYDMSGDSSSWWISPPVSHDTPRELEEVVLETFARASPEFLRAVFPRVGPSGTFSALTGASLPDIPSSAGVAAREHGVIDHVYLHAAEPDDTGFILMLGSARSRTLSVLERRRLARIAAHLGAARRLVDATLAEPAVVFESDGRVAHATGATPDLLESLRRHLKTIEQSRSRAARAEPDAALAAWTALVEGRYSLVDRFESDGRRYVVAHENPPHMRDPRGLTRAEAIVASWAARGHSDKLIAYELGRSLGTVSSLLSRAYGKLRVRSRSELLARLTLPPSTQIDHVTLSSTSQLVVFESNAAGENPSPNSLTPVERELYHALSQGLRTRDIALERGVSERTVKNQLTALYKKLGVRSRVEAARFLIAPDSPSGKVP